MTDAGRDDEEEEETTNLPNHLTALAKECLLSLNPLHAILCLEATFQNDRAKFPAGSIEEAKNRLMIGKILNAVTENQAEAKRHLEMGAFTYYARRVRFTDAKITSSLSLSLSHLFTRITLTQAKCF